VKRGRRRKEGGGRGKDGGEEKAGTELKTFFFSPLFFSGCLLVYRVCGL